ncbi:MAG: SOS-response transcriptional repressor LexA [Zhongshania marina]|jgi:SOS-response transcriptional repressor LexA
MTIGKRIQQARKLKGWSQAELAEKCEWEHQSRISSYERDKREPEADDIKMLARVLGRSAAWLFTGEESNVESAPQQAEGRLAPVIDFITAGAWGEAVDPYPSGTGDSFEPINPSDPPCTFWLRVRGDSMTSPASGQSIPEGYLIKVNPEKTPENGSLVIAKLEDSNEATFKKLVIDAGMKFLKPLNPAYPTIQINGNCRIVGVVTEARMKL